jgi:hypothetical protein
MPAKRGELTFEQLLGNDILDAYQLGILAIAIVQQALAAILVDHMAVVIRDGLSFGVVSFRTEKERDSIRKEIANTLQTF